MSLWLSLCLLHWPNLTPRGCIFLCLPNKAELWHWVCPSLQIFVVERQNWGNYKLPQHIQCHISDLDWLKQPQFGPCKAEAKHSRSPTLWKLPQWKLNMKKTQLSGSDRKPSMLESRTAKTNSAESSHGSVWDSRKPLVEVESPHPYDWKDIWLTKS